jgi:hypothetical protein
VNGTAWVKIVSGEPSIIAITAPGGNEGICFHTRSFGLTMMLLTDSALDIGIQRTKRTEIVVR